MFFFGQVYSGLKEDSTLWLQPQMPIILSNWLTDLFDHTGQRVRSVVDEASGHNSIPTG
jgi:hypothetical protein